MRKTTNHLIYQKELHQQDSLWTLGSDVNNLIHLIYSGPGSYYINIVKLFFFYEEIMKFDNILNKFLTDKQNFTKEILWINHGSQCLEISETRFLEVDCISIQLGDNPDPAYIIDVPTLRHHIHLIQEIVSKRPKKLGIKNSKTNNRISNSKQKQNNKKVFIVHGHAQGIKESVARLVEQLGLEAIILHEQANKGRTIIEKFLDFSDVSYAIILLTGDDQGGIKNSLPEKQKRRARQNVILELGFFLGKLGRENVCTLYEENVEIPSDYSGVLFIPLDDQEAWKLKLIKEFKAAGLEVDIRKVL